MERKDFYVAMPVETTKVVVHSCCAPCSTALLDCLIAHHVQPVVFYYNPNIFPKEEYEIRKAENKRYAKSIGVAFYDGDYTHDLWKERTQALRFEPERGKRCLCCFTIRLTETARFAHEHNYSLFTTTLATSRWKDLLQINEAGLMASADFEGVTFWPNNWRRNGLTEKQAQLVKAYDFYRQQYCGCEYSLRDANRWRKAKGVDLIFPARAKNTDVKF